jgi:alpha-L-rhamnosidase
LETPQGPVAVSWSLDLEGELELDVTLPEGVTGLVRLPGGEDQEIGAGEHHLSAPALAHV